MRWAEFRTILYRGSLAVAGLLIVSCGGGGKTELSRRYRAVRPGVAFEMIRDNPDLVVLDVRPFADYSAPAGHLESAVSAPLDELDVLWPHLGLSDEDTVLLYSGDGGRMQMDVSRALIERGLRYVVQIDGGLEAWLADGFSVRVEDAPLSPLRPPNFE